MIIFVKTPYVSIFGPALPRPRRIALPQMPKQKQKRGHIANLGIYGVKGVKRRTLNSDKENV